MANDNNQSTAHGSDRPNNPTSGSNPNANTNIPSQPPHVAQPYAPYPQPHIQLPPLFGAQVTPAAQQPVLQDPTENRAYRSKQDGLSEQPKAPEHTPGSYQDYDPNKGIGSALKGSRPGSAQGEQGQSSANEKGSQEGRSSDGKDKESKSPIFSRLKKKISSPFSKKR